MDSVQGTKSNLPFLGTVYVLQGFLSCPEEYEMERFFIMELRPWSLEILRVLGMQELGQNRNVRSNSVLVESGGEEKANAWCQKFCFCLRWNGEETERKENLHCPIHGF